MNVENVMLFILGVFFVFIALKLFIFFFKNGGLEIGISAVGTRSLHPKTHVSKDEQLQLVLRAALILIIGIALLYTQLPLLLGK